MAVYVVWSSQLSAKQRHVASATTLMPDPRAQPYWDPDLLAGKLFQPVLRTPRAAWDVWMLFDRTTRWPDGAWPEIAWWEQQLSGMSPELHLDPARFSGRALDLQAERNQASEGSH